MLAWLRNINKTPVVSIRNRRLLFGLVASLCILLALSGVYACDSLQMQRLAEKQWNDLLSRGVIRVGIDPGIKPFSTYDDTGWTGMDADVMRELARRLNLRAGTAPVGYDSLYDALHLWQVDVVISAVPIDPSRTAEFAYTRSYFDAGLRLLSLKQNPLKTAAQLSRKRVVVVLGSDADRLARYWQRRLTDMTRLEAPDDASAFAMLQTSRADAMIAGALTGERIKQSVTNVVDSVLQPRPYAIALRKDNPLLLQHLNDALKAMQSDGTLQRIIERWTR